MCGVALDDIARVSCDVTAHIHGDGKSRDMRGRLLDVDVKRGLRAAEALRAYSEPVYPAKRGFFHFRVKRLGISHGKVAAERFFREIRALLEIAAYSNSYDNRRARVAPRNGSRFNDKINDILL